MRFLQERTEKRNSFADLPSSNPPFADKKQIFTANVELAIRVPSPRQGKRLVIQQVPGLAS